MICLHCQVEFAYVLLKLLGSEQHTEKQPRQPRWYQFTQFDAHPFQNSKKKRCFHFFGCKVTLLRGIIRNFGGNFPSPKPFFFGAQKLEKHHKTASKIRNAKEPCINVGYGLVANGINLRIGHSWAWRGVVSTNTAPTQNGNLWYKDAM